MPHSKNILIKSIYLSLLTSGAAFAAPPVAYDGWRVDNGVVDTSTSCSAASISCKTIATDNGFKYEEVTTPDYVFLRLILTDADATGATTDLSFTNETFSPFALVNKGIAQGAATKQVVRDAALGFELVSEVQKGNMRGLNAATAEDMYTTKLSQTFANADFTSGFKYKNYTNFYSAQATNPDSNTERGRTLEITQEVLVGEPGDATKKQAFVHKQQKGSAGNNDSNFNFAPNAGVLPPVFMVNGQYFSKSPLTTAGSMTLPVTVNGAATTGTNSVAWAEGNDISTTWIAQSSNVNATGVDLNYQRVANATTGVEATAVIINLPAPVNPFDWDTANFGTQPTLN